MVNKSFIKALLIGKKSSKLGLTTWKKKVINIEEQQRDGLWFI